MSVVRRGASALVTALLGGLLAQGAFAQAPAAPPSTGGIGVSPIRVDLKAGERGAAVTLSNQTGARKTIQVAVMAWSQVADEDRYVPATDLLVNPPIFFVEPGASQIVRIGRPSAAAAPAATELSWRVYLREVINETRTDGPALRVAITHAVPVFMAPPAGSADLAWRGILHRDGAVTLWLDNRGSVHARAADVRVLGSSDSKVLARAGGFNYVLAGASRSWRIPPGSGLRPGTLRIAALMEEGPREFAFVLRAQ